MYEMVKMTKIYAKQIVNWQYPDALSIYNLEDNEETLKELLQQEYYAVLDKEYLVGYFCCRDAAIVPYGRDYHVYDEPEYLDIGLGLNPQLIGRGLGFPFFKFGLDYFKKKYNTNHFRLTVLDFNKKAIHIYHKAGFQIVNYFKSKSDRFYFLVMTLID